MLGASPGDDASHAAFREEYSLPFALLADPDMAAAKACGVEREDSPYPERATSLSTSTGRSPP